MANGHLAHKGEKVVGDATGILTDAARGMGANGVEVSRGGMYQLSGALDCRSASIRSTADLVWPYSLIGAVSVMGTASG